MQAEHERPSASGPGYYERVGHGYAKRRQPDPRIQSALAAALGDATTVLNVGAGPGSYEPRDRVVVAVEPSTVMLAQRTSDAPRVRAVAEALPFRDRSFDAALAVLTLHHWSDWRLGVSELRRVAGRTVVLAHDIEAGASFWLFDYFPQMLERDRERMQPLGELCGLLHARATPIPVPHDCTDGFLCAHWRTPSAYLDAGVRSAISAFSLLSDEELAQGLERLESDIASGRWRASHGALLSMESVDLGYRVVVGRGD
jgi:ubiquinone/menaquinone biosynthesis C-methylase UbiE